VDAARIVTGDDVFGILNLAFVWLSLQQLGFFLADGRIGSLSRRSRGAIAAAAVGGLALSVVAGVHSPDLIENINPPTTALLFVGVAHAMVMSLLRERLNSWSRSRLGVALRTFVTPRAMTIYLWHMPVLLAMAGGSAMFAIITGVALPEPGGLAWWATRPLWLIVALALTAAVAVVLARIETLPAPPHAESILRLTLAAVLGIAAIAAVLVLGTTPMTAVLALTLILSAFRLARSQSREGAGTAQAVSAAPGSAPWPMRTPGSSARRSSAIENANTAGNVCDPPPSVATPSPASATATADAVESEIDSADELNPALPGAEYASVSTVSRG
jgi:hypothetical protein